MEDKKESRKKRRNYIIICALLAIILSVSTYAWFIGLQDVRVSSFDVKISSADSLTLSLTGGVGNDWATTVYINEETYTTAAYSGNTNTWGGTEGLIPMSSVGDIYTPSSTLKLYEKASLTASPDGYVTATAGGYRLLASRVHNWENGQNNVEQDGYVAFDLFIRNLSGTEYYTMSDRLNEEAIYLTKDSEAVVSSNGGVEGTGIENSVRVAFAPIARVKATTTIAADTPSALTCVGNSEESADTKITGICDRNATVWEPNDTRHVDGAITWYSESCLTRTGAQPLDKTSYVADDYCNTARTVVDNEYYTTYAINREVAVSDGVDIYDGWYNNYWTTIEDNGGTNPLKALRTFTDTDKLKTGTNRPTFITLAPNSITKVRVYIWIEGQDIDNYDFASAGKKIQVGFGFTKERYDEEDIAYNGPIVDNARGVCFYSENTFTEAQCKGMNGVLADNMDSKVCLNATYRKCFDLVSNDAKQVTSEYFLEYPDDTTELSTTCINAKQITSKVVCDASNGTWDASTKTCSGNTVQFCDAAGGYYSLGTFTSGGNTYNINSKKTN